MNEKMHFTFSDLICGYITKYDHNNGVFGVKTPDLKREFDVRLTAATYAEIVRNLDEKFMDATGSMRDMIEPGRFVFVYGIFYPEGEENAFEAKHIVFAGGRQGEFRFERPDWWVRQAASIGDFYLKGEFSDGNINFKNYSTILYLNGRHDPNNLRQETDTISRLVYGMASAYMLTGEDRFLEAAENGTKYLREHMRCIDDENENEAVFWYHGITLKRNSEKEGFKENKIFASESGEDIDAIPAYEQIYALAGPAQTYRVTGDRQIIRDIERTVNFFNTHFIDKEKGGYYSHIDPITFDPNSEALKGNKSRKNWNSIGDHAPAYLINTWLATGEERYKDFLKYTADLIVEHFPDSSSPFVQEKFHSDWSCDSTWGWQQNRGVVGHNLKISWNLIRLYNLFKDEKYVNLSKQIAGVMPAVGFDTQRGGWYDVLERKLEEGQEYHRFVWHDRKAWWQQEQGILAYLILYGTLKAPEYLKLARESSAFYNAWFLDTDSGGVYFNVLANGIPYLLGTERQKGSHSMATYHSTELAYLAAVYTNLLIRKQPMDFYFKPYPGAYKDNLLRVQPDILPQGSICIEKVWIDGREYGGFDANGLTVSLPETNERIKVKVRISPSEGYKHFETTVDEQAGGNVINLAGELTAENVYKLDDALKLITGKNPSKIIFDFKGITEICAEAVRVIAFESHKLSEETKIVVRNADADTVELLREHDFDERVSFEE